ncbi:hypothetical protein ACS0TY_030950 [Phlomoides rotata]
MNQNRMSDAKEVELCLKVFINKEKTKVLFAEVDNDFADVLLSFLTLPLGKIVKILEKHYGDKAPSIGSLTTLYNGLKSPDMVNLWEKRGKEVLNNAERVYEYSNLKFSVDGKLSTYEFGELYDGVFTRNSASFIVCDDLRMLPNVSGSILQTLTKLGVDVMEMSGAVSGNVTFGLKEVIDLLRGLLISPTPLTDIIFMQKQTKFATIKSEAGISLHQFEKAANFFDSKKMILKVMSQKSSKKLLFAEAEEDFVEFLFSLLIIPLGIVEWLLGSNTCLNNIDNLYRSIADLIDEKYLKGADAKDSLMKPKVNSVYSDNCFLPLSEASFSRGSHLGRKQVLVAGSRMYMVTDDLTVTRLCMSSALSHLDQMKISLSDVEEVELHIGLEEALNIVKASLTSTCALTDGLINLKLKKLDLCID